MHWGRGAASPVPLVSFLLFDHFFNVQNLVGAQIPQHTTRHNQDIYCPGMPLTNCLRSMGVN